MVREELQEYHQPVLVITVNQADILTHFVTNILDNLIAQQAIQHPW